ncbi:GNAT family N-acetyltransferase [Bifidobacterium sp. SMB2]|uniref:GNAT family N-acetyltransferase n=1 Tax=Bifidobacterium saimiriisciurei TaxID=2661627 RepID=A0ABX0CF19_9BIFI|nr:MULTISPECIES: GNAT family N-acetyltransferase [Bifidobacterium]NEG95796.1 GNAT family N-acetyltransferase [Bifidobacterium sp. SMB2]NEH11223.1 GNAT family N-acetyltransferase [Bifidobacterium saimiriisciurei]
MTSQAVLRAMRAEDMPKIEDIVRRTWSYDGLVSPRNAGLLARVDACNCLSRRTFMRVADIDGDVAGLIVVNDRRNPRRDFRLAIRQIASYAALAASRDGRQGLAMFHEYMRTDRALSRDAESQGMRYDGEVVLFIVNDRYRGRGVGRMLFDAALEHMRSTGIEDFFLYTDTTCDFGFYDHRGLSRRCERRASYTLAGRRFDEDMYIYDGVIGRLQ